MKNIEKTILKLFSENKKERHRISLDGDPLHSSYVLNSENNNIMFFQIQYKHHAIYGIKDNNNNISIYRKEINIYEYNKKNITNLK